MAHKIFITGGAGFIGRALSKSLSQAGHQVWSPDFDLLLSTSRQEIQKNGPWDVVIHLAGISDTATCQKNPEKARVINVDMTGMVAETVAAQSVKPHFIFASTGLVYQPSSGTLTEESLVEPQGFYAETKAAAEVLLKNISQQHNLPVTVVRIFNHTHSNQDPRFFLPFLYQEILKIKTQTIGPVIHTGSLKVRRDLGTIQDLMRFFNFLVGTKTAGFEVLNLCSGQSRLLENLAHELARQMKEEVKFQVDPAKLRKEQEAVLASCEKAKKLLQWQPEILSDEQFIEKFLGPLP